MQSTVSYFHGREGVSPSATERAALSEIAALGSPVRTFDGRQTAGLGGERFASVLAWPCAGRATAGVAVPVPERELQQALVTVPFRRWRRNGGELAGCDENDTARHLKRTYAFSRSHNDFRDLERPAAREALFGLAQSVVNRCRATFARLADDRVDPKYRYFVDHDLVLEILFAPQQLLK